MSREFEVLAAEVAADAHRAYALRQYRWGWFVLFVFGCSGVLQVVSWLDGGWWWVPWVGLAVGVWGLWVVLRMWRRVRAHQGFLGEMDVT